MANSIGRTFQAGAACYKYFSEQQQKKPTKQKTTTIQMTNQYDLAYDHALKQFDLQYPIFLQDKEVAQQDFINTVSQASAIYANAKQQALFQKRRQVKKTALIALFAFGLPILATCLLGRIIRNPIVHVGSIIAAIILVVIGIAVLVKRVRQLRRSFVESLLHAEQQVTLFLAQENANKYFAKGVQFLMTRTTAGGVGKCGRGMMMRNVSLTIVTSSKAVQNVQSYIPPTTLPTPFGCHAAVQQQQATPLPLVQQQPQQVYPSVYSPAYYNNVQQQ